MSRGKVKYHKRERKNLELRAWIMANGVEYKEIAKKIYVSQSTLSQWFQHDMQKWQRDEVIKAVKEIMLERGSRNEEARRMENSNWNSLVGSLAYVLDSDIPSSVEEAL